MHRAGNVGYAGRIEGVDVVEGEVRSEPKLGSQVTEDFRVVFYRVMTLGFRVRTFVTKGLWGLETDGKRGGAKRGDGSFTERNEGLLASSGVVVNAGGVYGGESIHMVRWDWI